MATRKNFLKDPLSGSLAILLRNVYELSGLEPLIVEPDNSKGMEIFLNLALVDCTFRVDKTSADRL
jgi:hypothetical protein